ncbi:MAG: hypothetical protein J7L11_08650 [Thermoprotei archaeon]|nr:hypothetical protein [Thermoprotei archaeon]
MGIEGKIALSKVMGGAIPMIVSRRVSGFRRDREVEQEYEEKISLDPHVM